MTIMYCVKDEFSFGIDAHMRGKLTLIGDRPQTRQYLMKNDEGEHVVVSYEFFHEYMEIVPPVVRADWIKEESDE